jgi:hypothetical protein
LPTITCEPTISAAITIDPRHSINRLPDAAAGASHACVHASPNYVATAVVLVPIAVGVRVIATRISVRVTVGVVVIRVAEAESEAAAPEVAITESTTTEFTATTKFTATKSFSHPATTETASHPATAETTEAAAMEAATTKAATVATAHAATAHAATAAVATATATTTRQRHRWRSQANGRNCQQRDNRFAQHNHSPSETLAPNHNTRCRWQSFWKIAIGFDESITQLSESDAD